MKLKVSGRRQTRPGEGTELLWVACTAAASPVNLLALQVLKILLYLCGHGSSSFLLILRRNSALIQEATGMEGHRCVRGGGETQPSGAVIGVLPGLVL